MRRLLPFVLLAGCATAKYMPTNPAPFQTPARDAASVEILRKAPAPGRGYVELGVFDACNPTYGKPPGEDPKIAEILKEKGGKLGCQAVLMESMNHIDDGLSSRDEYRARCLVFTN